MRQHLSSPKAQKKPEPVVYKQSRINYDWISPSLFGCEVKGDNDGSPNRKSTVTIGRETKVSKKFQFIQFATQVSQILHISYAEVVRAFIGDNFQKVLGKMRKSQSQSSLPRTASHKGSR
jgi:hypothetical protein